MEYNQAYCRRKMLVQQFEKMQVTGLTSASCVSIIMTLELLDVVSVRHHWPGVQPGPGVWEGGAAEDDAAIQVSDWHYHYHTGPVMWHALSLLAS